MKIERPDEENDFGITTYTNNDGLFQGIFRDINKASAAKQLTAGGLSGWCAGYLFSKVGKVAATALAGSLFAFQLAQHRGYIKINWTKHARTQKDILDQLPNKETTFDVLLAMRMFSTKTTKSLGDFEKQYMFDDIDKEVHKEFIEELTEISETIKKRNDGRKFYYPWLYPENIPNSVGV